MNLRRVTSLTALLCFLVVLLTSFVLYICPHGRVAYWADWTFFGISKDGWGSIHINTGILFLLCLLLHLYYNWTPVMDYLKDKSKDFKLFTADFNIALVVTLVFIVGTMAGVPPFSSILDFSEDLKEAAGEKYGEPPYGHAELSTLKTLAKRMDIDLQASLVALQAAGYEAKGNDTVIEAARRYGVSPQAIYSVMTAGKAAEGNAGEKGMPKEPKPGLGKRTIADLAEMYGFDADALVEAMKAQGMAIEKDATMKENAVAVGVGPHELYELIREALISMH